jgi:negative regulator of sigma-B (phosphoserine phosphatase)
VETISVPLIEYGVATFVLPGQTESGDQHLVCCRQGGILIAAIDGIGHGEEAAAAAKAAVSLLKAGADEPVISLVQRCHEGLRSTRGIVLSLASIDPVHGMMTWLGVGNVQGVLMRAGAGKGVVEQELLLRAGVVGSQMPPLQAAVLPIAQGDTLIFATDGVRSEFVKGLSALEPPQRAADRILEQYGRKNDDALVFVARLTGIQP